MKAVPRIWIRTERQGKEVGEAEVEVEVGGGIGRINSTRDIGAEEGAGEEMAGGGEAEDEGSFLLPHTLLRDGIGPRIRGWQRGHHNLLRLLIRFDDQAL